MNPEEIGRLPYRPCVGLMLLNRDNRVFVARRIETRGGAWQMPQGGIDEGEAPREAALRELEEEIGTNNAEIIAEGSRWFAYDLPAHLVPQVWGGRFRGQRQKWFALRFLGEDKDIRLDRHKPEFSAWRWVRPEELPDLIVAFKRQVYREVLAEFEPLFARAPNLDVGTR